MSRAPKTFTLVHGRIAFPNHVSIAHAWIDLNNGTGLRSSSQPILAYGRLPQACRGRTPIQQARSNAHGGPVRPLRGMVAGKTEVRWPPLRSCNDSAYRYSMRITCKYCHKTFPPCPCRSTVLLWCLPGRGASSASGATA